MIIIPEKMENPGVWSHINDRNINKYLDAVVNFRNSEYTSFIRNNNDLDISSASEEPVLEISSVNSYHDNALDSELERLRLQERSLKEDINKQTSCNKLIKERSNAQVEKMCEQIDGLHKKTLLNKNLRKDMAAKNEDLKEESRNITLTTKELVDRLAFPKSIIRNFLKVSDDSRCQNEDFCRNFGGGKCLTDSRRSKT